MRDDDAKKASILRPQRPADEKVVLGECIVSSKRLKQAQAAGVTASTFYTPAHGKVWETLIAMANEGEEVTAAALMSHLAKTGGLSALGGRAGISDICYAAARVDDFPSCLASIIDAWRARRMNEELERIEYTQGTQARLALLSEVYARARDEAARDEAARADDDAAMWNALLNHLQDKWQGKRQLLGTPTGYKAFDAAIDGLQGGNVYVLAARPGMGKTSLALNMFSNIVESTRPAMDDKGKTMVDKAGNVVNVDCHALFISLEMPAGQLMERLWYTKAGVPKDEVDRVGTPSKEVLKRLLAAMKALRALTKCGRLVIDDTARTMPQIAAAVRRAQATGRRLDAVFVDYIQLIYGEGGTGTGSRNDDIASICASMKGLAKSENVPIVVLSQLNRQSENRADKRPMLADLRDSGAIEQIADAVAFPYRAGYHDEDAPQDEACIILAKNRHGAQGEFPMLWNARLMKFIP